MRWLANTKGGSEVKKKKILTSMFMVCFMFSACSSNNKDIATNQNPKEVVMEVKTQEEVVEEPVMSESTDGVNENDTIKTEEKVFDLEAYDESLMQKADGWSNGSMFDCTWRGDNVSFQDGTMTLTIDQDVENSSTKWSGGEYRTKDFYHYGKYEVSMKPIKNDGVVSSFFTYTGPSDNNPWDEIDIEFLGKDTTIVQFNYFTNGIGGHEFTYELGFDASEEFHVYGFEWLEESITWYVDGVSVYTATEDIPSTPAKIMMNVWPGVGVDSWLNAFDGQTPLQAQYDWFKYTK
jgi:beta-glucanase (GH16 family)